MPFCVSTLQVNILCVVLSVQSPSQCSLNIQDKAVPNQLSIKSVLMYVLPDYYRLPDL